MALTKQEMRDLNDYLMRVIKRTPTTPLKCPVCTKTALYTPETIYWKLENDVIKVKQIVSCQLCKGKIQYDWNVRVSNGNVTVEL